MRDGRKRQKWNMKKEKEESNYNLGKLLKMGEKYKLEKKFFY